MLPAKLKAQFATLRCCSAMAAALNSLKPPAGNATLQEWRELGTTGTTDGEYGEDPSSCRRRRLHADFPWLVEHWGLDGGAIRKLVGGVIDSGRGVGGVVDMLREHVPTSAAVLAKMNLIKAALQSSCATGDVRRRREAQAEMVEALQDRGFEVNNADRATVGVLRSELSALRASKEAKLAMEAKKKETEARMIHPGHLVTHQTDLDGLDSRDLRHVDETYELWSCCGRGPKSTGCILPSH